MFCFSVVLYVLYLLRQNWETLYQRTTRTIDRYRWYYYSLFITAELPTTDLLSIIRDCIIIAMISNLIVPGNIFVITVLFSYQKGQCLTFRKTEWPNYTLPGPLFPSALYYSVTIKRDRLYKASFKWEIFQYSLPYKFLKVSLAKLITILSKVKLLRW